MMMLFSKSRNHWLRMCAQYDVTFIYPRIFTFTDSCCLRHLSWTLFSRANLTTKIILRTTLNTVITKLIKRTTPLRKSLHWTAESTKANTSGHVGLHIGPRQLSVTRTVLLGDLAHLRRAEIRRAFSSPRRIAKDNHIPGLLKVLQWNYKMKRDE